MKIQLAPNFDRSFVLPFLDRIWFPHCSYLVKGAFSDSPDLSIAQVPIPGGLVFELNLDSYVNLYLEITNEGTLASYSPEYNFLDTDWSQSDTPKGKELLDLHLHSFKRCVYLLGFPLEVSAHEAAVWISDLGGAVFDLPGMLSART